MTTTERIDNAIRICELAIKALDAQDKAIDAYVARLQLLRAS